MPTLDVVNATGQKVSTLELSDELIGEVGDSHVVWEGVRHHLAAERRGTVMTKTRGEVSGGGRKPWKQKGTGRARVGSSRNPLWRHGGTAHGPQPRDYDYALPRKKKRVAMQRVLASMLKQDRVTVVDAFAPSEPRTRVVKQMLGGLGVAGKALLLVHEADANLIRAARNLGEIKITQPEGVNAYDLLRYRRLLATSEALGRLQEVLSR